MTAKTKKEALMAMFIAIIIIALLVGSNESCSRKTYDGAIGNVEMVCLPSSTPSHIIEYNGFTVDFNNKMHMPNYVVWELTRAEVEGKQINRKDFADPFTEDTRVTGCATLADYKNSGYSRGHMAPASDMGYDADAYRDCFYLTNMAPQKAELNNGAWKSLEDKCRAWAKRDSAITIICGPVLTDRMTKTIGKTPVPVPERFFKVILAPYANPPRAIGFIMPNGKVPGGMQAAAMSVDEVEAITGIDFFSSLPDELENVIEAECNFPLWSQKSPKK